MFSTSAVTATSSASPRKAEPLDYTCSNWAPALWTQSSEEHRPTRTGHLSRLLGVGEMRGDVGREPGGLLAVEGV